MYLAQAGGLVTIPAPTQRLTFQPPGALIFGCHLHRAPFQFDGTLKRLYFKNLQEEANAIPIVPDD